MELGEVPPSNSGAPSWAGPHQVEEQAPGGVSTDPPGWPSRGTPIGITPPTSEFLARSQLTSNLWLSGPACRPRRLALARNLCRAGPLEPGTDTGPRGPPGLPEATACHRPALPSGLATNVSPEAQGPLNQTSPPWSGRLQSKLDTTGETSKSPPPAPTSQGSLAPTLLSPAPHHRLLSLELPQAQLCRLQGQGAPVLYTLASPDTTKALTPDGPAVEGRVGIHPGNLGQAQPPSPAPQPSRGPQAGGSSDRSSWPRDGEARATARQTN